MSTLVTENIKRPTETASRSARGIAAMWMNLNGTGTIAIRRSLNVASVVDVGVGSYSANLTSAAADGNGAVTVGPTQFALGNDLGFFFSATRVDILCFNNSSAAADNVVAQTIGAGDLA